MENFWIWLWYVLIPFRVAGGIILSIITLVLWMLFPLWALGSWIRHDFLPGIFSYEMNQMRERKIFDFIGSLAVVCL